MNEKDINTRKIELRENVIGYIYSCFVLEKEIDANDAFEIGEYSDKEVKIIGDVAKKQDSFIKLIKQFTKASWAWDRISALNRAILVYGSYEMLFNDKALVIDVMVKYAKEFCPDESYKFINSVLEKVGTYYEKNKRS